MYVIKRDGSKELVKYDKIATRIRKQTYGLDGNFVDSFEVAQKVIQGVYDGVTSVELDDLSAETAASMTSYHPDYSILASRIAVSALHKSTCKSFFETIKSLYEYVDAKTGLSASLIDEEVYQFVESNQEALEHAISYDRDFNFDYFGYKTLEKSYLLKIEGKVVERPQHMWLRVACGIWKGNLEQVLKTYNLLSTGYFTHATPTLFNAGTKRPQLSSCFLLELSEDSIEGIFDTLKNVALISKNAGGIGIHWHKMRSQGAYIKGTNGTSNGIIPFLKIYNETARAVDQCFTGETEIDTEKGTKKISDIIIGDKVLTHDSTYQKVIRLKEYEYSGVLVNIKVNGKNIKVTPDHLFLVKRINGEIDWIEAKNILKTDQIFSSSLDI